MKAYLVTGLLTLFLNTFSTARPAAEDTLKINQKEAEALFINSNLDLVAQKLSIQQAEAQIIQAKLWSNPEFSIDELNLWATRNQLSSAKQYRPYSVISEGTVSSLPSCHRLLKQEVNEENVLLWNRFPVTWPLNIFQNS